MATKGDVESAMAQSNKQKKRMKCLAYVAAFAVFQTTIILVFSLTMMRIKSPKYRLRSVSVEDLTYTNASASSPSFDLKLIAEIGVKNTNFGHFKFDNSTVTFSYRGTPVGQVVIAKARARARSTRTMDLTVDVSSDNVIGNENLGRDIDSGILMLTSSSKLSGKVHLMKVIKKNKSAEMNCTTYLNLADKVIQDIKCK